MRKNKLMKLHRQIVEIRDTLVEYPDVSESDFSSYNEIEVGPDRSKATREQHQRAIFTLGAEIADVIADDELDDAADIRNRMEEMAENKASA